MTKRNLSAPPKECHKRVTVSAPTENVITPGTISPCKMRANSTPPNAHIPSYMSTIQTPKAPSLSVLLQKDPCVHSDAESPANHSLGSTENVSSALSSSDETQYHGFANTPINLTGLQTLLTPYASSLNNTIIPGYSINSTNCHCSVPLTSCIAPETFPIFGSGDVLIMTNLVSPAMKWQLHSVVLARHSTWFESSMKDNIMRENENPNVLSYIITVLNDKVVLVHQRAAGGPSSDEINMSGEIKNVPIKIEGFKEASISPSVLTQNYMASSQTIDYAKDVETYNHIFGTFYNAPNAQTTMTILEILEYAERLIEVAHSLGCTQLMASQIGNMFLQYRKELFVAIKNDPARWLSLAFRLQNDIIYVEALIHIVGAHPCWPWPTKQAILPEEISQLIVSKSKKLDQMCLEAERNLLCLSILVGSRPVRLQENSEFDTWFIVATFRDIIARELYALGYDKKCSLRRGRLFRKIFRGGSEYMSYKQMRSLMEKVMPSTLDSLSEDLNMLKGHASEYVKDLAKNELILDVESNGVGYLTCTKITAENIPWRRASTSNEEIKEST